MRGKPPACTGLTPPHSLTYSRFYVNGWWCDRHSLRTLRGLPALEPGPGWPIHLKPPPDTSEPAAPPAASTDKDST
ncbi:hypothetical protein [Streptomyces chartreusis]|uniref:hypothetical protein n=1 Tax=Streptomyces chartreusis TaxID=1969 RepID=UPI0033F7F16B